MIVGLALYCGGPGPALAWLNGQAFYLSPRHIRLEDRAPGAEETVTLLLKNLTSQEISLVGDETSCSCLVAEKLPIKVNAHETGEIKLRVSLPEYQSDYDRSILLMMSARGKLKLADVRVTAAIPNPLPEPKGTPNDAEIQKETGTSSESEASNNNEESNGAVAPDSAEASDEVEASSGEENSAETEALEESDGGSEPGDGE